MVRKTLLVFLFLLAALPALAFQADVQQVCFSPDENCTAAIVERINDTKSEILIQAYGFTSTQIAKAVVGAHKRGVKVEAILDKSNETGKYSSATFISNHGIPVFIDGAHPIAHNKILIIDKEIVISGSFNFTRAAAKNAENVLIIKSGELARAYIDNWMKHKEHCEVYRGRHD